MNTNTLHAHVSTSGSDCDGRVTDEYVTTMNQDELDHSARARGINDFSDLMFKARVLSNHVSFSPLDKVQVEVSENGFTMYEVTEEGCRTAEVIWCEDECDGSVASHTDLYAEMMGY